MKATDFEFELMKQAVPVLSTDTEENWLAYEQEGNAFDKKLVKDWRSVVPGSLAPCYLVIAAIAAMENRGYDVSEAEALIPKGLSALDKNDLLELNVVTGEIYRLLHTAPKNEAHPYWSYTSYDSFEQLESAVSFPQKADVDIFSNDFHARIKNAWTAQIIGSSVGTQMEGYTYENIKNTYGDITNYLKPPETYNDDITYEIAFLDAFSKKGYIITSNEIAHAWLALIPDGYSAEETALRNLRNGIFPPQSGTQDNFFSDWIGAQMRTAIHGMVAPGNPKLAAELAWKDSCISHANNGILGGVFNAVLTSLAFTETSVRALIEKGIALIPQNSEYHKIVSRALMVCKEQSDWTVAWKLLENENRDYHWIHAYPNAAAEVLALYYGDGDFSRTLNIVCQAGRDTDCNTAQILSILGVMGVEIPPHWIAPIGGKIKTFLRDYRDFTLDFITNKTVTAVRHANKL